MPTSIHNLEPLRRAHPEASPTKMMPTMDVNKIDTTRSVEQPAQHCGVDRKNRDADHGAKKGWEVAWTESAWAHEGLSWKGPVWHRSERGPLQMRRYILKYFQNVRRVEETYANYISNNAEGGRT